MSRAHVEPPTPPGFVPPETSASLSPVRRLGEVGGIKLPRDLADEHRPGPVPLDLEPGAICSCGTSMYAATPRELAFLWRIHLAEIAR